MDKRTVIRGFMLSGVSATAMLTASCATLQSNLQKTHDKICANKTAILEAAQLAGDQNTYNAILAYCAAPPTTPVPENLLPAVSPYIDAPHIHAVR